MSMLQPIPSSPGMTVPMSIKGVDTLTNTVTNSSATSDDDLETALDSRLSSASSSTASSPNTTLNKVNDISPILSINGTAPPSLLPSIVNDFLGQINDKNLDQQSQLLFNDFNEALQHSKITMLPNYNINPSGNEFGQFLVIDLGGSTLRIAIIKIDKPNKDDDEADRSKRIHILNEKSWIIENNFKIIDNNFFKFIGSKIAEIVKQDECFLNSHIIKTGISWSFPLKTTNYNNGKIVHVSKGYTISDEIYNKDLKRILESVLKKEFNLLIDIKIILNDSLAVYAAGSFMDKFMKLALVLGTGTNMCCSLKKNSNLMHPDKELGTQDKVLFNTEMSLFGQSIIKQFTNKFDGLIDSRFNQVIDLHFKTFMTVDPITNTIFQPLELTTSGRYLPELTRLVLCDLINAKEIFTQLSSQDLAHILHASYDGITGKLICFINETDDLRAIKQKLHDTYDWDMDLITSNDLLNLRTIIETILTRGAFIISISVIAFIKLLKLHNPEEFETLLVQKVINIGYVGSVLHHFNNYRNLIKKFINENSEIRDLGLKVDFKLIENSSVIGPAIGAAYYS